MDNNKDPRLFDLFLKDPWDVRRSHKDYSKGESSPYWEWMERHDDQEPIFPSKTPYDFDEKKAEQMAAVHEARKKAGLNDKEKQVLALIIDERYIEQDVADEMAISQPRVHKIWENALHKLKIYLAKVL